MECQRKFSQISGFCDIQETHRLVENKERSKTQAILAQARRVGAAMGPADPGQLLPAVLLRRRAAAAPLATGLGLAALGAAAVDASVWSKLEGFD